MFKNAFGSNVNWLASDQVYNGNNWKAQGYRVHFRTINEMKKLFCRKFSREAIYTGTFALRKLSYTQTRYGNIRYCYGPQRIHLTP